jgi:hypothetical protein
MFLGMDPCGPSARAAIEKGTPRNLGPAEGARRVYAHIMCIFERMWCGANALLEILQAALGARASRRVCRQLTKLDWPEWTSAQTAVGDPHSSEYMRIEFEQGRKRVSVSPFRRSFPARCRNPHTGCFPICSAALASHVVKEIRSAGRPINR